jgi:hypothetical protein
VGLDFELEELPMFGQLPFGIVPAGGRCPAAGAGALLPAWDVEAAVLAGKAPGANAGKPAGRTVVAALDELVLAAAVTATWLVEVAAAADPVMAPIPRPRPAPAIPRVARAIPKRFFSTCPPYALLDPAPCAHGLGPLGALILRGPSEPADNGG